MLTAALVAVLAVAALLVWRAAVADSDGDGLTDRIETAGWSTADGAVHRTDPQTADTDGDGLTDLDEAGQQAPDGVYAGWSDPLVADTDADGLSDGREADAGLDPRTKDMDGDGLLDGAEVDVVGTDPQKADTDGDSLSDGYEEANRESQGVDPLSYDEQTSRLTYIADFATGFTAGELVQRDSLAWFAGDLVSGATGLLPGIGWITGGAADVRDAIGAAIHGDWVGAGFNIKSAVPGRDLAEIPRKAVSFLERHPTLAVKAAALVARLDAVPDSIKVKAAALIWKDWDGLVTAGADEKSLLQLERGRTDLEALGDALRRHGHVAGAAASPFADGPSGERFLESLYGARASGIDRQVRIPTAGCTNSCASDVRIVDVLVDGVAHESKVGAVRLSAFTERQIKKDAWLVSSGAIKAAHWHFFASSASSTVLPDKAVLDLLDKSGIAYTIHLPRVS